MLAKENQVNSCLNHRIVILQYDKMYVLMLVNSRKLSCSSLYASLVKFDQILALAPL